LRDAVDASTLLSGGIDALLARLAGDVESRAAETGDEGVLVASLRQIELLEALAGSLASSERALREMPLEAALVDLRHALRVTGEIIGIDLGDAVLDHIFATFCLGK
jgi:tRNA modification GTPase